MARGRPKLQKTYSEEAVWIGARLPRQIDAALAWVTLQKTIDGAGDSGKRVNLSAVIQELIMKEFKSLRKKHKLGDLTEEEVRRFSKKAVQK